MNREDRIMCFEEIGWVDPSLDVSKGYVQVANFMKELDFYHDVYPAS